MLIMTMPILRAMLRQRQKAVNCLLYCGLSGRRLPEAGDDVAAAMVMVSLD